MTLILSGCMNISAVIIDWIEMGSPVTHSGKHALHVRHYAKTFSFSDDVFNFLTAPLPQNEEKSLLSSTLNKK